MLHLGNGQTNDYEIMRKKWSEEETLSYVYSEKAEKGFVMEGGKKDRISSQESAAAEPEPVSTYVNKVNHNRLN